MLFNKKIFIRFVIFTCLLLVIIILALGISKKIKSKKDIENNIATLPSFQFYNLQNQPYTIDSLQKNKKTLLLFFNTTCEHCQYETEQIIKNKTAFEVCNTLFVSNQSLPEIKSFDGIYHILNLPSLTLLRDSLDNSKRGFGVSSIPSSFIYDVNGKLVTSFKGEVKIEAIIAALK